jgi:arylsulfatase
VAEQPNVLLITTDHWPAHLLGIAGHPVIQTPTLDELSRCGVRFTNAYTECPVCIPARRTLQTGVSPRTHGDRIYKEKLTMPQIPTMAGTFRAAGYQAFAVGKLHVFPQRNRIGFDDVILDEEGRTMYGVIDDYEMYLGDQGLPGRQFLHGMANNDYAFRPWHLAEEHHATNWATREMARVIKRRDPTKPAFWFTSYRHPHPPLVPLQTYLDMYRPFKIDEPQVADWVMRSDAPYAVQGAAFKGSKLNAQQQLEVRRAFYALCTHIDHQIRVLIGTLREEGILNKTIICFSSDHGDMLGNHSMWAKRVLYQPSVNVPMILIGATGDSRVPEGRTDDRIVGWQDIMPTLLDLCGIEIPETVEGISMVGHKGRDWLYCEVGEDLHASRMVTDGRYKLIYYPVGNRSQLFDTIEDPSEMTDLSENPEHKAKLDQLSQVLISQLYGGDEAWAKDGAFVGAALKKFHPAGNRTLSAQRGSHWPPPPQMNIPQIEWNPEKPMDR